MPPDYQISEVDFSLALSQVLYGILLGYVHVRVVGSEEDILQLKPLMSLIGLIGKNSLFVSKHMVRKRELGGGHGIVDAVWPRSRHCL